MNTHFPARPVLSLITACTFALLASCSSSGSGSGETDQDLSDRYQITSEFLGADQLLTAQRADDDSTSLGFTPRLNAAEDTDSSEALNQEWVISLIEDNVYRFTNRGLGEQLSLDVVNDGVFDQLTLATTADASGQRWMITTLDNGYCRFTNEFTGPEMVLDISSDTAEPMLTIRPVGDFSGQHWELAQLGLSGLLDTACVGSTL